MIELTCGCGKTYRLADETAGKKVRCQNCGKVLDVPFPSVPPGVLAPTMQTSVARKKSSKTPVLLGICALLAVAGGAIFFLTRDNGDDPPKTPRDALVKKGEESGKIKPEPFKPSGLDLSPKIDSASMELEVMFRTLADTKAYALAQTKIGVLLDLLKQQEKNRGLTKANKALRAKMEKKLKSDAIVYGSQEGYRKVKGKWMSAEEYKAAMILERSLENFWRLLTELETVVEMGDVPPEEQVENVNMKYEDLVAKGLDMTQQLEFSDRIGKIGVQVEKNKAVALAKEKKKPGKKKKDPEKPSKKVKPKEDLADLVAERKPSIAVIRTDRGAGTGFLIDKEGHVLTNYHVVAGARTITATFLRKDGKTKDKYPMRVEYANPRRDIARLAPVTKRIPKGDPLVLATGVEVRDGESVFLIGNPGLGRELLELSVSTGTVSKSNRKLDGQMYIQTNAAINPGNSGGPMFNMKGEVIGIVVSVGINVQNIGFAIPIDAVKNLATRKYIWSKKNRGKLTAQADPREVTRADLENFLRAAMQTDWDRVRQLLKAKPRLAQWKDDRYETTLLHWAAANGHKEMVKALVEAGADVLARDYRRRTALDHAIRGRHKEVVTLLRKLSAPPSASEVRRFLSALKDGNVDRAKKLLGKRPSLLRAKRRGDTPLCIAAGAGKPQSVLLLLERGRNLHEKGSGGRTPLHSAVRSKSLQTVKLLVKRGANVNARDKYEATPLQTSALNGSVSIAEFLLDSRAHISARNKNGWTPLHWAAHRGHVKVLELLLDRGADPSAKNKDGKTPLEIAVAAKHKAVAKILRDHAADE